MAAADAMNIDEHTGELVSVEVLPDAAAYLARQDAATLDVQVSTAKAYPRSIQLFQSDLESWCTLNREVADECHFALPRDGKKIIGPSVRFAELVLAAYGNMIVDTQIVEEARNFVMVTATCRDLQRNTATRAQVRRSITGRNGRRFADSMVETTILAASAIARRNAIFQAVPKALWLPMWQKALAISRGDAETFEARKKDIIAKLKAAGVKPDNLKHFLGGKQSKDINADELVLLRMRLTEIEEKRTTADAAFPDPKPEPPVKGEKAAAAEDALKGAASKLNGAPTEPDGCDSPEMDDNDRAFFGLDGESDV